MEKYSEEELPSLLRQYREELALPSVAGVSQLALLLVAAFSALVFILLLFTVCLYCRLVFHHMVKNDRGRTVTKIILRFSKKRDKDDHHDIYQEQITTVNQMGKFPCNFRFYFRSDNYNPSKYPVLHNF